MTPEERRLRALGLTTQVLCGEAALCELAAHPEATTVLAAIVGVVLLLLTPDLLSLHCALVVGVGIAGGLAAAAGGLVARWPGSN